MIEMLRQRVTICFASGDELWDYKEQIKEAIYNSSVNLKSRHGIYIRKYIYFGKDYVEIIVDYPRTFDDLSLRHFSGISRYLLKTYSETFKNKRVGKKLLSFYLGPIKKLYPSKYRHKTYI